MELIMMPPPLPPVDIRLTHQEAQMLLSIMQNPLCHVEDTAEVRKLREELFETLRRGLSGTY